MVQQLTPAMLNVFSQNLRMRSNQTPRTYEAKSDEECSYFRVDRASSRLRDIQRRKPSFWPTCLYCEKLL